MIKNNTGKEVFYIFVWLVGIVLLYTLVFTFILEPSQKKSEIIQSKHLISHETVPKQETTLKKPSIPKKIETSIQEPLKSNTTESKVIQKKEIKIPETNKIKTTKPKAISTPSIPAVVKAPQSTIITPSTPSIPSIPAIPTVKKVATQKKSIKITTVPKKEIVQSKKETPLTNTIEKPLSTDINIKRIETKRQQVRRETREVREEALKFLTQ